MKKLWLGWVIMHRNCPTRLIKYTDGRVVGISGYIYIYPTRKMAKRDLELLKNWNMKEFKIIKVVLRPTDCFYLEKSKEDDR